jgi:hypothetical protein
VHTFSFKARRDSAKHTSYQQESDELTDGFDSHRENNQHRQITEADLDLEESQEQTMSLHPNKEAYQQC